MSKAKSLIAKTLDERGGRYGRFEDNALLSKNLQAMLRHVPGSKFDKTPAIVQEALDQICLKISRICNGDPAYLDNWVDIQGYAKLVEDWWRKQEREARVAAVTQEAEDEKTS